MSEASRYGSIPGNGEGMACSASSMAMSSYHLAVLQRQAESTLVASIPPLARFCVCDQRSAIYPFLLGDLVNKWDDRRRMTQIDTVWQRVARCDNILQLSATASTIPRAESLRDRDFVNGLAQSTHPTVCEDVSKSP